MKRLFIILVFDCIGLGLLFWFDWRIGLASVCLIASHNLTSTDNLTKLAEFLK